MKLEQLAQYDIKLLVAFKILLEEENVSRAAQRMQVTQSAMSKMLAKLKDVFKEELFIRTSHGVQPTDKALALKAPLNDALDKLNSLLTPVKFKPAHCTRTFRLSMLDNAANRVIPGLLSSLSRVAPQVKIQLKLWSRKSFDELAEGQLDLAFNVVEVARANFYQLKLADIQVCAIVRKGHPLASKKIISLDDFLSYSFIKVIIPEFNEHHQKDQQILAALGRERKIVFETHNPICALQSLEHTDYIMLGAKGPTNALYEQMGLTAIEIPKELVAPKFSMKFIWHQRQHLPAEQVWFRKMVMNELAHSMKP